MPDEPRRELRQRRLVAVPRRVRDVESFQERGNLAAPEPGEREANAGRDEGPDLRDVLLAHRTTAAPVPPRDERLQIDLGTRGEPLVQARAMVVRLGQRE